MKRRNLFVMFILTIITLGIYQVFWTYFTKNELNRRGQKVPSFLWLMGPFMVAIAGVVYGTIDIMRTNGSFTSDINESSVVALVIVIAAMVVALPIYLVWFWKYCQAADAVTNGRLQAGLSYVLLIALNLIGLAFVWPLVMQNYLNNVANQPTNAPTPVA